MEKYVEPMEFFSSAEETRVAAKQGIMFGEHVSEQPEDLFKGIFDFDELAEAGHLISVNDQSGLSMSVPVGVNRDTRLCRNVPGAAGGDHVSPQLAAAEGGKSVRPRITEREAAYWIMYEERICKINQLLYRLDCSVWVYRRLTELSIKGLLFAKMDWISPEQATDKFVTKVKNQILARTVLMQSATSDDTRVRLVNGTFDCVSGKFTVQKDAMSPTTAKLRACYTDPDNAASPNFDQFLDDVSGGDSTLVRRIWQVLGYLMVPDQSAEVAVLFQGLSGTGKSVLVNFLVECFYPEDRTAADIFHLHRENELGEVVGKLLLVNSEMPDKLISPDVTKTLKQLTGKDRLHAKHPDNRRESIEFRATAKILLCSNYHFDVMNLDEALCRRIVVVPFKYRPKIIDSALSEKLAKERDAVVTKALRSYRQLVEGGYRFAGDFCIDEVVENPIYPSACILDFLKNGCLAEADVWTSTGELYGEFCRLYGEDVCSVKLFSTQLLKACRRKGLRVEKARDRDDGRGNPIHGFQGLMLKAR